ncbi:MAG: hypothetical protein Q8S73_41705 [Deltaproteobacteria bacterium]|nr:hypothetical protein [Myxococcales bacterium]MDP3220676.1 hypothetical protein [Deltaproteobacteria bacterium]
MPRLNPFLAIPLVYLAHVGFVLLNGRFRRRVIPDQSEISVRAVGELRETVTRADRPGEFWFKVGRDVVIIVVMVFIIVAMGGWTI